jgi:long-subunit fatty acid transport protein
VKKKITMLTSVLIIIIIAIAVWVRYSNVNQLKNVNTADIVELIISDPTKYYSITKHEDIQTLFNVLQSINLSKKFNSHKDGSAFLIDIKLKSGEKIYISILSKDVRINNHNYKPDKDYCNSIREVFDALSKKYENKQS